MAASAEMRAFGLAQKWVEIDSHYEDKTLTPRERDLMLLAIRCLWSGNLVEDAINQQVAIAITREEFGDGSQRDAAPPA